MKLKYFIVCLLITTNSSLFSQDFKQIEDSLLKLANYSEGRVKAYYYYKISDIKSINPQEMVKYSRLAYWQAVNSCSQQDTLLGYSIKNVLFSLLKARSYQYDSCKYYINKAIYFTNITNHNTLKGELFNAIGMVYLFNLRDYENAINCFLQAVKQFELIGNNNGLCNVNASLGLLFRYTNQYDKSLSYYKKALDWAESIKDTTTILGLLNNIGNVFIELKQPQNSMKYYKRIYDIFIIMNNKIGAARAAKSIADCYNKMGNYKLAEIFCNQSFKLYNKYNELQKALLYSVLSDTYLGQGKIKQAILAQKEAIKIAFNYNEYNTATRYNILLGEIYEKISDYDNAKKSYYEAVELAKQYKFLNEEELALTKIANLHFLVKNYDSAYYFINITQHLKDSIFDQMKLDIVNELEKKYAVEKAEMENQILKDKNKLLELETKGNILLISIITLGFVLFAIISLLISKKTKNKRKNLEFQLVQEEDKRKIAELNQAKAQLQALQLQMNPHHIFNTLNAIQFYIYNYRYEEAIYSLSTYAMQIRAVLEQTSYELISLFEEEKFLTNYLTNEKMRYDNKFMFSIHFDDSIDKEMIKIPPMLLQPIIENSIEHGIKPLLKFGIIDINFRLFDNFLCISIEDNGIGRQKSIAMKSEFHNYTKHSTIIIERRIELLSTIIGKDIKFNIKDYSLDIDLKEGTLVEIIYPLN